VVEREGRGTKGVFRRRKRVRDREVSGQGGEVAIEMGRGRYRRRGEERVEIGFHEKL